MKAILSCFQRVYLGPKLWRCLSKLGISKTKATLWGCRAGVKIVKRQKSSEAPLLSSSMTSYDLPPHIPYSERESILSAQDGRNLHNLSRTTLNIQADTSDMSRININPLSVLQTRKIPVRISSDSTYRNGNSIQKQLVCRRTFSKPIPRTFAQETRTLSRLPSFYMANARSIRNKLDEFSVQLLTTSSIDIGAITESWLHNHIDSAYLNIPGYVLHRRDRPDREGGGVCVFVTTGIPCTRRVDLEHPVFECMWLWLQLHCLPRPFSGILCGIVYFPEAHVQENRDRVSYINRNIGLCRASAPRLWYHSFRGL